MDFLAKLKNIVRYASITGPANNADRFPVQQMTYKGKEVNVYQHFPFGVYANCSDKNSLGLLFAVEGDSEVRAAICGTPENRPRDLEQGEVAFYHPATNSHFKFRNNGNIDISVEDGNTKGTINILGPIVHKGDYTVEGKVKITGDVEIIGNTTQTGNVTQTGDYNLTGNITQLGNFGLTGNLNQTGTYILTGAQTISLTLGVTGQVTVQQIFSQSKDIGGLHTHLGSATAPSGPISNTGTPL